MGKRLRLQRRGKGTPKYAATNHAKVEIRYNYFNDTQCLKGQVVKLYSDPIRTAPVAQILFENGSIDNVVACEGLKTGDRVVSEVIKQRVDVIRFEGSRPGNCISDGRCRALYLETLTEALTKQGLVIDSETDMVVKRPVAKSSLRLGK